MTVADSTAAADPLRAKLAAAVAQHRSGKLAEAERAYREIIADDPGNADALHLLGALRQQGGKPEEAISFVRQAIARKPESALYHNTLGIAYAATRALDWAVEAFTKAASLAPGYVDPHMHLGNLKRGKGDNEAAVGHFEQALRINPNFAEAHNNLGTLLIDMERWRKAESHLVTAARLRPQNTEIAINLAVARRAIDPPAAIAGLEAVLAQHPDHPAALANLGAIHADLGDRDLAIDCLKRALAAAPDNPKIKQDLANAYSQFGRHAEASALYREIAESGPPQMRFGGLISLATIAERDGDFETANGYLDRAYQMRPDAPAVVAGRLKRQGKAAPDDLLRQAESLAEDGAKPSEGRAALRMALGTFYAGRKQFDRAFASYTEGNRLRQKIYEKRGMAYDKAVREARVDAIIRRYDAEFFRAHEGMGSDSELPVFVVGMPRSGTTLCEQILASHSEVHGADELMDIPMATARLDPGSYRRIGEPDSGPLKLDPAKLRMEADRYLRIIAAAAGGARRVVDKLPANFENLGLIAALFPRARIVHCRRDPRDVALSCFTTNFAYPLIWSLDLDLFTHYYIQYRRLMEHWRRVLPKPMLERVYETAVADFAASARRLVEFCGLDWQESCLEFYKTERAVRTASIQQVRQPVYTSSIGRWRDYEAQAPDFFRRIGELAEPA
jgi:tetratricopeptide (TPR) repeat protein